MGYRFIFFSKMDQRYKLPQTHESSTHRSKLVEVWSQFVKPLWFYHSDVPHVVFVGLNHLIENNPGIHTLIKNRQSIIAVPRDVRHSKGL